MERMKIVLAIGLGCFLGGLVAKEINPLLWWLGLIVGGFTGFLSYEYKKVPPITLAVWQEVSNLRLPEIKWWKEFYWITIGMFSALMHIALFCLFVVLIDSEITLYTSLSNTILLVVVIEMLILIPLAACLPPMHEEGIVQSWKIITIKGNIFSVYFHYLPKKTFYLIPDVWHDVVRFTKIFFKTIYTEIRLLCGIHASIGVAISYFTGNNIFLGMVCGITLGLISYELISKRFLIRS